MRGIDGQVRIRAPEGGDRWPANATCDLSVVSAAGPSASVYLTESDVRALIRQLAEQLDPPEGKTMGLTIDPNDPRLGHGIDEEPLPGQHDVYLVLSDEERAKGFTRPLVTTYVHARQLGGCGVVTSMGLALSETYARDPNFYGATYCVHCRMHKAVGENGEFYWSHGNGEPILSEGRPWKVGT